MLKIVSILGVIVLGVSILWLGTDGFRAFTAESARFLEVQREQPELPPSTAIDENGVLFELQKTQGRYALLTFMYTTCGDVCPILESNFADIYRGIPGNILGDELVFLSISFDPTRDTPEKLQAYSNHFRADGASWKMVTIPNEDELTRLLETLGVIVIPNESDGFEHNSAFYLINKNGRLTDIFDYRTPQAVLDHLDTFLY